MTKQELRLEALRLAHRHAEPADEVIKRAKEYEKFVLEEDAPKLGRPPKQRT